MVTEASGAVQFVAPGLVLNRLARQPDQLSRHLFATIGMFMVVAGGACAGPPARRTPIRACWPGRPPRSWERPGW